MIEAPLDLQKTLKVPQNHYDICRASNTQYLGNAAGNTIDAFNLDGQNESVPPLPAGFTARGVVALVFSCISAILGMAVIAWCVPTRRLECYTRSAAGYSLNETADVPFYRYGAAPISSAEVASAKKFIAKAGGGTM